MAQIKFNVLVHEEDDGSYWSEIKELPGCFASGFNLDELKAATFEAMQLWLPDGIKLEDPRWSVIREKKGESPRRATKRPPRKMLVCA